MKNKIHLIHRSIFIAALLGCAFTGAHADNVYRISQSDGRVIYTDNPEGNDKAIRVQLPEINRVSSPIPLTAQASGINANQLPYEVKRAHESYPVTLYTTANCAPCGDARNYLIQAGIPFSEYTVSTVQDTEALKQQTSLATISLPILKIGGRALLNFNQQEWGNYLQAAGYPKKNQLPSSYKNPSAKPLTDPALNVPPPTPVIHSAPVRPNPPAVLEESKPQEPRLRF